MIFSIGIDFISCIKFLASPFIQPVLFSSGITASFPFSPISASVGSSTIAPLASRGNDTMLNFPISTPGILFIMLKAPLIIFKASLIAPSIIPSIPLIPLFTPPPIASPSFVPKDENVLLILSHNPLKKEGKLLNTSLTLL